MLTELAFVALGSNIEPERNLPLALQRLASVGRLVAVSNAYRNPAVGPKPQPEFLNAVARLEYAGSIEQLRAQLRQIEAELGRVRTEDKYAPRTIDLDPVWLGEQIEVSPHFAEAEITQRAHLAVPLAELAPQLRHPDSGERLVTIAERLSTQASMAVQVELSAELQRIVEESTHDSEDENAS